jgi:DNA helicase IV
VAVPFYRATFVDPMDLDRRRRFTVDGPSLLGIFDEVFDDPDSAHAGGGGVPDPLLAELERARTGEMRDIVATIQAEQDVIIRAPLDELIIVQGGPGTGKTAVGLHRAAFLLYEHRRQFEDDRLLVLGPNRLFLRYISQVLPSLGEHAVVQATVESLFESRYRVRGVDDAAAARVKGDTRMAEVLARALRDRLVPWTDDLDVALSSGHMTVPADEVLDAMVSTLDRGVPWSVGRDAFRRQVERIAYQRHLARPGPKATQDRVTADLRADRGFRTLLDKAWPSVSAAALVRQVLGNRDVLARAAAGLLDDDEQDAIQRRPSKKLDDERWTEADLALLDEAEALVAGATATYGHVVVDEAQDLSAMELRLVARRARGRSMTVLGDLAQATEVWSQRRWDEALTHLGAPDGARIEELGIGYRVPGPILEFANRLLPVAAPHVRPARSVRATGDPPRVVRAAAGNLAAAVAEEAASLGARWTSVGVVVPASLVEEVEAALGSGGVAFGDARRAGLDERVTVLLPPAAKGLEFDAVLVVEPARMVAEEHGAERILYVALTRAVQHLSVVHEDPLPTPLSPGRAPSPAPAS